MTTLPDFPKDDYFDLPESDQAKTGVSIGGGGVLEPPACEAFIDLKPTESADDENQLLPGPTPQGAAACMARKVKPQLGQFSPAVCWSARCLVISLSQANPRPSDRMARMEGTMPVSQVRPVRKVGLLLKIVSNS